MTYVELRRVALRETDHTVLYTKFVRYQTYDKALAVVPPRPLPEALPVIVVARNRLIVFALATVVAIERCLVLGKERAQGG